MPFSLSLRRWLYTRMMLMATMSLSATTPIYAITYNIAVVIRYMPRCCIDTTDIFITLRLRLLRHYAVAIELYMPHFRRIELR